MSEYIGRYLRRLAVQQDFAGIDDARFAVACRDLHRAVEIDDVLTARGRVPVEIVGAIGAAEDDAGRRHGL